MSDAQPGPGTFAYMALLLVQITNAAYNVLTKVAMSKGGANPLIYSLYRDIFAFPLLQTGALVVDGPLVPDWEDVPWLAYLGLTGMFGNQFFYIVGLKLTNQNIGSIMSLSQPVFASVFSTMLGREPFSWSKVGGLLLCIGGAIIMLEPWEKSYGGAGWGYLSFVAGNMAMASYYIVQKPMLKKYPPVTLTAWSYFFGAVTIALAALYYVENQHVWSLTKKAIESLIFAIIMNSVLKYVLQSYCNKLVPVTVLTAWSTLVPIFSIVFGYFDPDLRTKPKLSYLGGLPILAGLWMITILKVKAKKEEVNSEESDPYSTLKEEERDAAASGGDDSLTESLIPAEADKSGAK